MIKQLQQLQLNIGRKKLRKLSVSHLNRARVINFTDAKTIGILFNASDFANFETLKRLYEKLNNKHGKRVTVLGFVDTKEPVDTNLENLGFTYFTKKETNLLNFPVKPETVKNFTAQKFDILINLSLEDMMPLHYVLSASLAKFKTARFIDNASYADLFIDVPEKGEDLKKALKEIDEKDQKAVMAAGKGNLNDSKSLKAIQLSFFINQAFHYLQVVRGK